MQEIAWKDENKNWQKIVIKREFLQLSLAFFLIALITFIICSAAKIYPSHEVFVFLGFPFYALGLLALIAQRWESYHYKINEVELTIFDGKGKAESIDANNSTISSIKRFGEFNVVHLVKNTKNYSIYINNHSEEWEILKSLLKIPAPKHK